MAQLSRRRHISGKTFKNISLLLVGLTGVIAGTLLLANTGIEHPGEMAALRDWMFAGRYGWLLWRLMLYAALGWGVWKIRRAPGFKPEYQTPLLRMTVVSVAFILVCEYALFSGMEGVTK
ncbi:TPA: hypothetical protein KIA93_000303 [Salmonella enterica]|uniref:hypothetical protein n=1 Tax=Salmonella enterica TaxID=28901 RepID=UPI0009B1A582|nr:hypothetical protein [Salmonella enterica]HBD1844097.1 hypothetical protein [Salmonella enterica]